jgi:small acid-soluble spore protein H (minor)
MDIQQAYQIVQSTARTEVRYQGVSVWIDKIDEDTETAHVHSVNDPDDKKIVSIQDLKEGRSI